MASNQPIQKIIISRIDAIGDVILTLPMCGLLKKHFPNSKIIFIGRTYTKAIINCCEHVDAFVNVDELFELSDSEAAKSLQDLNSDVFIHVFPNKRLAILAKKAKIRYRIGTTNRLFHLGNVNTLVRLSRKNSLLHEAQLNVKLLEGLGLKEVPSLKDLAAYTGFTKIPSLSEELTANIDSRKINVILHPKSNASAREWNLSNYKSLISILPAERYRIFISGTEQEKSILNDWLKTLPSHVMDLTGKLSLVEFIAFIKQADYLVAASTGPLHIAAACGIGAIGIYPPIKPMHPGRWQPIGKKATFVCIDKACNACKKNPKSCSCINDITALQVSQLLT